MNLYLDDDSAKSRLVTLLRQAGHNVLIPSDAGKQGTSDARHFEYATLNRHVLLTRNYDDFLELHDVVQAAGGQHRGILVVRSDNDPTRDMTDRGIVSAIVKLEKSGVPITNQLHVLNHWR
jgi:predicted nuclease of predicted toxin-antitoxin system